MPRLSPLTVLLLAALPLAILLLDHFHEQFLIFDPERLHQISAAAIAAHGTDVDALLPRLVTDLQAAYPGARIQNLDSTQQQWVFNVAGGAVGAMYILHASLTEYLILFGSATGTAGHSGVHLADDYFTLLAGTQTAAFAGELRPRAYTAGMQHHHPRLTAAQYAMEPGTWALELAQGVIPAMLPFGLVQMPAASDLGGLARTVWYTGRHVVGNLLVGKV